MAGQEQHAAYLVQFQTPNISDYTVLLEIITDPNNVGSGVIDPKSNQYYVLSGNQIIIIDLKTAVIIATVELQKFQCSNVIAIYYSNLIGGVLYGVTSTAAQKYFGDVGVVLLNPTNGQCSTVIAPIGGSSGYYASAIAGDDKQELSILTNAGLIVVDLAAKTYVVEKSILKYTPEYFTGLSYA